MGVQTLCAGGVGGGCIKGLALGGVTHLSPSDSADGTSDYCYCSSCMTAATMMWYLM